MKTRPLDIQQLGEFIVECGYGVAKEIDTERTTIHYLFLIGGASPEFPWLECERNLGINPIAFDAGFHNLMLIGPYCETSAQCWLLGRQLWRYIDDNYPGWLESFR